ncbi:MAG TPA: winged helix DNA-binding domain-containing protein [Jiangellales bacterium]|nr:winged helix DNA-binding domain-containing protein [Jiangellales bacterium]
MLSLRTLNRTLLQRQFLLQPADQPVSAVLMRLVAVQGQEPNWPYVGLWARVSGFRTEELSRLVAHRHVVRGAAIRATVHLMLADDYCWLRPTVQPVVGRLIRYAYHARELDGLDVRALADAGRELLGDRALTRRELGRLLSERFPGRHPGRLASAVELLVPLVHAPANAAWGSWRSVGPVRVSLAETWIDRPGCEPDPETMITRYLAGYGPATVMDIQAWSGLTKLGEVVERMRPVLKISRDEQGRELFDVPDAPIADPDIPAPVRFMPAFDNALLGHRDRTRIIDEGDRKRVARDASAGVPVFLLDGFARGTWAINGERLSVTPFRPLAPREADAVAAEAERLCTFAGIGSVEFEEVA